MKPQTAPSAVSARALACPASSDATREVAQLRVSIDRILRMMRECDDPGRKIRLNNTLFVATQNLATLLRK